MFSAVPTASQLSSIQAYTGFASPRQESPPSSGPQAADDSTMVNLSAAGKAAARAENAENAGIPRAKKAVSAATEADNKTADATPANPGATQATQLTPDELKQLDRLKARDRAVRAHEQAHQAAARGLATGGASYTYQRGPDGVNYAIGGEVSISLREGRTPEETIANAQTIRAAALAPADPSPQDRAVAAAAGQIEARARVELATQATGPGATAATKGENSRAASTSDAPTPSPREPEDAQTERTRARLDTFYGQITNRLPTFAATA